MRKDVLIIYGMAGGVDGVDYFICHLMLLLIVHDYFLLLLIFLMFLFIRM